MGADGLRAEDVVALALAVFVEDWGGGGVGDEDVDVEGAAALDLGVRLGGLLGWVGLGDGAYSEVEGYFAIELLLGHIGEKAGFLAGQQLVGQCCCID